MPGHEHSRAAAGAERGAVGSVHGLYQGSEGDEEKTWKAKVHGVGKRPRSVLQQQGRGLPMRPRRNRRDRRAGSFYSSTSERKVEKRRGNRGRWVFHCLEGAGCAVLGSPPAQKTNLSCRRF